MKLEHDERRNLADRLYELEMMKEAIYKKYITDFDKIEKEIEELEEQLREL